jgi:hypothetical protein
VQGDYASWSVQYGLAVTARKEGKFQVPSSREYPQLKKAKAKGAVAVWFGAKGSSSIPKKIEGSHCEARALNQFQKQ